MRTGICEVPDTASARSSITAAAPATSGMEATRERRLSAAASVFPAAGSMRRSASKRPICLSARLAKPLNTLSTTTMAITAMATPPTATPHMTLTAEWLLRECR